MSDSPTKKRISPLHTHSVYSVLDGASSIDQYIDWCKAEGNEAPALSLTDHGWAIGLLEGYTKCKKAGLTFIPGCEFYLAPDSDYDFSGKPYDYYHVTVWAVNEAGYRNLLKLASKAWDKEPITGWNRVPKKDLSALNAKGVVIREMNGAFFTHGSGARVASKFGGQQLKPRITFDELLENHEGIVLGSGCIIGALNKAFLNNEFKGAEKNLMRLLEVYKGRMFMEVMPHACTHDYDKDAPGQFVRNECTDFSPDGDLQKACNNKIVELAKQHDLPIIMTMDSHFTKPDHKKIQDILLTNGEPNGWRFYNSYHMLNTEQAWEHWKAMHGDDVEQRKIFTEGVENNSALVEMAKNLKITDGFHQPTPDIPHEIVTNTSSPSDARKAFLYKLVDEHGRMKWGDPVWEERLFHEIKVICDNGIIDFSDYFLFLEKWYRWSSQYSIFAGPGRGSGAGSLLCYLLKITHLNPFTYNLPFSRFLSQARLERQKFPDIDCDFGNRDLLVSKLREEYGDKMAQCSTLHTLKVRSAIKDACRSILKWNSNDPRIEVITKSLPKTEPMGVMSKDVLLGYKDGDGVHHDGWIMENPALDQFFAQYPDVYSAVMELLGIPRAVSRHASAFLISDRPIYESVPTCQISGYLCTQYQATAGNNMVEKAGLIKFDLLRVNTLDDISNCIRLVQKKFGYKVWDETVVFDDQEYKITRGDLSIDCLPLFDGTLLDIYDLPADPEVFKELGLGRTETVFQMNSSLMTGFTKRIRPKSIMDISDIVALVRPGPLEASVGEFDRSGNPITMTEAYIKRRHGELPIAYAHPDMEPILKDTYGVAVYQEQLQQMFQDLAGYTPEEADSLRETLAKKQRQKLEAELPGLRARLKARKWSEQQIEVFVSLCIASSAYSFNRAHSAAYAVVAYQCAFLKTNFPLEWWTAVLQNAKVEDIREKGHAQTLLRQGILKLPSVNGPTDTFKLEEPFVKSPLYLIDRVGPAACNEIERARKLGGLFTSLQDFYERVDSRQVNEAVVHNLILCGAFTDIEPTKDVKDLVTEFHYYKEVRRLKIGKDKTGQDLRDAVALYKAKEVEKNTKLSIPAMFNDDLQNEILRVRALPIYRLDVHDEFKGALNKAGVVYSDSSATLNRGTGCFMVYRNLKELEFNYDDDRKTLGAWAGLIQDTETFQYTDKKTKKKVTALKVYISNNGETIEAVLWPSIYENNKELKEDRIVVVSGAVRPAMEPGKWTISVDNLSYA